MAESSKWEKTLSALNAPAKQEPATVLLPTRPAPPSGKRALQRKLKEQAA
jgi:hypothetical protein